MKLSFVPGQILDLGSNTAIVVADAEGQPWVIDASIQKCWPLEVLEKSPFDRKPGREFVDRFVDRLVEPAEEVKK